MLSICIPIYNFDVRKLIQDLDEQIQQVEEVVELICIDDASEISWQKINIPVAERVGARYIQLEKNIGRSSIRNLFLDYSKFDSMLFLDCDSEVVSDSFVKLYLNGVLKGGDIICGGRTYTSELPSIENKLRWKYGLERESKPVESRLNCPHLSFMTNNFCLKKSTLKQFQFDERITQYGHEDTLFGFRLKQKNIPILHIDNPVGNGDIETNEVFVHKTEQGVESLAKIAEFLKYDKDFMKYVKLLQVYEQCKKKKCLGLISFLFSIFRDPIRKRLVSGNVNLRLFDFYKLGLLINCLRK